MKKILQILIAAALLCGLLGGCGHTHSWQPATCLLPKTCSVCGQTEADPAGHQWVAATCTAPKTCTVCNATEGIPAPHEYTQWSEAKQDPSGQWIRTCSCIMCGLEQTQAVQPPVIHMGLGTAAKPDGRTLLVSVFADDAGTCWDMENAEDIQTRELMRQHLAAAAQWLTDQLGAYGAEAEFLYDWQAHPDLYYTFAFDETLVRKDGGGYYTQADYIIEHIPTQELLDIYQAQNVIYIFYFNTDESNTVNSWSLSDKNDTYIELINVFVRDDYSGGVYYMPAASFAHEILHCFGAYDLYYASETIPQAYVDHCAAIGSNDIMYTVGLGSQITQEFTELDAYYVGLIDSCPEVDTWGLGKSTHLTE